MVRLVARLKTPFHCEMASPAWLQLLAAHVEDAIGPRSGYETADGAGEVYSEYNEPRFMGPYSLVRYYFVVRVNVGRANPLRGYDQYRAWVRFHADTNSFETQREEISNDETRRRERQAAALRDEAIRAGLARVVEQFEGREAIYVAEDVLRVRVTTIRLLDYEIMAEVEELPSPGLYNTLIHRAHGGKPGPLRLEINARQPKEAPAAKWPALVARAWRLIFDEQIVQGLVKLARGWPDDLPPLARYCEAGCFLLRQRPWGD